MAATTALANRRTRQHIAVIPCRWGASRFPGKPLAMLGDKPMLWHVYQRCLEAKRLDDAYVATDDPRIEAACQALGIPCMMTGDHLTGTDRVAECAGRLEGDAFINVQGDEPFIDPAAIDAVSESLVGVESDVLAVNAFASLSQTSAAAVLDHNTVKVVTDQRGNALMFSRHPIPYPRSGQATYLRQLGLYAFTKEGLHTFRHLAQGPLEQAEGVEMLRLLEHGHSVRMVPVRDNGIAVDTPEDLIRARGLMESGTWRHEDR